MTLNGLTMVSKLHLKHIWTLLLLVFFFLGAVFSTDCDDGWTAYHSSCYLFAHNEKLSFAGAHNYCKLHNSNLINVNDASENNFIKSFLTAFKDEQYWVGLSDDVIEGEWRWADTDSLATYTDWNPGEPNNGGGVEDCAAYWSSYQYHWNDVSCTSTFEPICERTGEHEIVG